MRVCDITREDEVVSAFTIIEHDPGTKVPAVEGGKVIATVETGKRATKAMKDKAWGELNQLTPYNLRVKSEARVEGAKKAKETRAANKAAAATNGAPAASAGPAVTIPDPMAAKTTAPIPA